MLQINIGDILSFGELWDGNYDGVEILESGCYSPDEINIVAFTILKENSDILKTLIQVTDIY